MESRLRLAGHGMQPLLLMFPLGLFWTAFVLDLATLLGAPALLGTVAFWNLVAGLGGGLLTAAATIADAVAATGPAAVQVFVLALLLDVGVLIIYAVLTLTRVRDPHRTASAALLTLELAGLAAAAFSAWFGGRLAAPGAPVADRGRPGRLHQPVPATTPLHHLFAHPSDPHPPGRSTPAGPATPRSGPHAARRTTPPSRHPAATPPASPRRTAPLPRDADNRRPPTTPATANTTSAPRAGEPGRPTPGTRPGPGRGPVEEPRPAVRAGPAPPRLR